MDGGKKIKKLLSEKRGPMPEIYYYKTTDSTNTRAKELARSRAAGVRCPAVFIAEEQTGGRGRLGRSFHSARGGVYISFLIYPDTTAEKATAITAYAAVMLSAVVKRLTGCEPKIKWVNDLYLGGKKLAGILTEGEIKEGGDLAFAVCGIGLNLSKSAIPEELSDIATAIDFETGASLDPNTVAAEIICEFFDNAPDFSSHEVLSEYKRLSLTLGSEVTVLSEPAYDGIAEEILPDYSLLVRGEGGERRVFSGEVSIKSLK